MTEIAVREEAAGLTSRRWLFGPVVLDERSLELFVRGKQVVLERKPLEVLLYLLHHAGEVVTKDDFAENLWPGRILTETVLARCVSVLRQALQDEDRTLIRTVHGYGYRLVAQVKVEATEPVEPLTLDFKAGDRPPTRPQWKLVERLGAGSHGEAWLARHDKTGDARVFKFAVNAGALGSLKREITLYRLLHDSLGARAAVARILEWNLEEPPYFIEMEHVAGGNLQAWCETQGGPGSLALPQRLELVAQVAEALASAHSVGALHKDLKPGNVLIDLAEARPKVKLCDFGSGTVLDPARLEALGITRLGFTQTLTRGAASATPMYLAPEVIGGQPYTVQADIYSLGILLFQLVTGDLRRAMAPGWEADVEDELLREDIAAAAAGNPARRLTDAGQLAERLRTLEQRRQTRAAEAMARQRAERARRIQEELRRTRALAVALVMLTIAAIVGGISAFRARDEAVGATATAKAISDFLTQDVLRVDSGLFKSSETSYEELLRRASEMVDVRLRDQPAAAASIHTLLGRRYQEIGQFATAVAQYERAAEICTRLYGEKAEATLIALDRLSWLYLETGEPEHALALSADVRAHWAEQLAPSDAAMLIVDVRAARVRVAEGDYLGAERELRSVIERAGKPGPDTERAQRLIRQWLGVEVSLREIRPVIIAYSNLILGANILEEIGSELKEAASTLGKARATFLEVLGEGTELLSMTSFGLANDLAAAGETEQAEVHAQEVRRYSDSSLPKGHFAHALSRVALARVRIEQRRFREAADLFEEALGFCPAESGCPPRLRVELLWDYGLALIESGDPRSALNPLELAYDMHKTLYSSHHPGTVRSRCLLAEAFRQLGQLTEASNVLSEIDSAAVAALGPTQQTKADFRRIEGLVLLQRGNGRSAATKLQEALDIHLRRLGPAHWRSQRLRSELRSAEAKLSS